MHLPTDVNTCVDAAQMDLNAGFGPNLSSMLEFATDFFLLLRCVQVWDFEALINQTKRTFTARLFLKSLHFLCPSNGYIILYIL